MSAPIPYMPLHIGEYLADAAHLTAIEHGAYLLLIMNYWQRGEALPGEDRKLARIARMTDAEWADARDTLSEFFTEADGRWTHKRIEHELSIARDKIEKKRNAGKASANSRSTDAQQPLNNKIRLDEKSSDASASDADDAASLEARKKALWSKGRRLLMDEGLPKDAAGRLLGKWFHAYGIDLLTEAVDAAASEKPAGVPAWITAWLKHRIAAVDGSGEQALVDWIRVRSPRMRPAERLEWARSVLKPIADMPPEIIEKAIRFAASDDHKFPGDMAEAVGKQARELARYAAKPKPVATTASAAPLSADEAAKVSELMSGLVKQMTAPTAHAA